MKYKANTIHEKAKATALFITVDHYLSHFERFPVVLYALAIAICLHTSEGMPLVSDSQTQIHIQTQKPVVTALRAEVITWTGLGNSLCLSSS